MGRANGVLENANFIIFLERGYNGSLILLSPDIFCLYLCSPVRCALKRTTPLNLGPPGCFPSMLYLKASDSVFIPAHAQHLVAPARCAPRLDALGSGARCSACAPRPYSRGSGARSRTCRARAQEGCCAPLQSRSLLGQGCHLACK